MENPKVRVNKLISISVFALFSFNSFYILFITLIVYSKANISVYL